MNSTLTQFQQKLIIPLIIQMCCVHLMHSIPEDFMGPFLLVLVGLGQ